MPIVTPKQTKKYRSSQVVVQTRLPSARAAYSEICLIKGPHESNNRTVEEQDEDADCKPSDCK
jgi:hypothetical protein